MEIFTKYCSVNSYYLQIQNFGLQLSKLLDYMGFFMHNFFLFMQLFVALLLGLPAIGQAQEITLPSLRAAKEALVFNSKSETKEKLAIYIFLSKDCPCSRAYLNYLDQLIEKYPEYNFIGIHAMKNKTSDDLQFFLNSKEVKDSKLNLYNDSNLLLANYFKAVKTPHVFIVNRNKVIYSGAVANSMMPQNAKIFYLDNALQEFKTSGHISSPETKALGCYIVR